MGSRAALRAEPAHFAFHHSLLQAGSGDEHRKPVDRQADAPSAEREGEPGHSGRSALVDEEEPVPVAHRRVGDVEAVLAADAVKHLDAAGAPERDEATAGPERGGRTTAARAILPEVLLE